MPTAESPMTAFPFSNPTKLCTYRVRCLRKCGTILLTLQRTSKIVILINNNVDWSCYVELYMYKQDINDIISHQLDKITFWHIECFFYPHPDPLLVEQFSIDGAERFSFLIDMPLSFSDREGVNVFASNLFFFTTLTSSSWLSGLRVGSDLSILILAELDLRALPGPRFNFTFLLGLLINFKSIWPHRHQKTWRKKKIKQCRIVVVKTTRRVQHFFTSLHLLLENSGLGRHLGNVKT